MCETFQKLIADGVSLFRFPGVPGTTLLHFLEPPDTIAALEPGDSGPWGTPGPESHVFIPRPGGQQAFSDQSHPSAHQSLTSMASCDDAGEVAGGLVGAPFGSGSRISPQPDDARVSETPLLDEWIDPTGIRFRKCVFPNEPDDTTHDVPLLSGWLGSEWDSPVRANRKVSRCLKKTGLRWRLLPPEPESMAAGCRKPDFRWRLLPPYPKSGENVDLLFEPGMKARGPWSVTSRVPRRSWVTAPRGVRPHRGYL